MNIKLEFLAITCNLVTGKNRMYVQGAIGFGFPSHWLKNLGEFLSVAFAIAKSKVI